MSDNEKVNEAKNKMESIKEMGNIITSTPNKSIQVLSIIGQIEGHSVLPPQTKATRYEHIIPQLIDIEQNVPEHVFLHCYACEEQLEEKNIAKYGCNLCPLINKLNRCGSPDSVYSQLMEKVTVQLLERYRDAWS